MNRPMLRGLFKKKNADRPAPSAVFPVSTEPLRLVCGSLEFLVGFTTRRAIAFRLGPAVEYVAFICGNNGRVERLALYANHEMPTIK